ncbi:DOMON domain-containing protein [Candidatus Fermentibacteria bacterium]|nr:MAG: DOMON domain-containing protein [Candidatus Fermentibacteria bacterium]
MKLLKKSIIFTALLATVVLGSCGDDPTGPTEGEGDWLEYTVDDFTFEWLVEDSSNTIRVKITAPSTGWVAVGFDPTLVMNEANLIIGYVSGGSVNIRDDFGTGQFSHDADTNLGGTNDVETISGSESGTNVETTLEFRIPLDSGDQYDKALVDGNTYTFIFAYGNNDADDYTSAHAWAESASFEL